MDWFRSWIMSYNWKWVEEILWAVVTGVAITFTQIVLTTNLEVITDWRGWLITLTGAMARGALIAGATAIRSLVGNRPAPKGVEPTGGPYGVGSGRSDV